MFLHWQTGCKVHGTCNRHHPLVSWQQQVPVTQQHSLRRQKLLGVTHLQPLRQGEDSKTISWTIKAGKKTNQQYHCHHYLWHTVAGGKQSNLRTGEMAADECTCQSSGQNFLHQCQNIVSSTISTLKATDKSSQIHSEAQDHQSGGKINRKSIYHLNMSTTPDGSCCPTWRTWLIACTTALFSANKSTSLRAIIPLLPLTSQRLPPSCPLVCLRTFSCIIPA